MYPQDSGSAQESRSESQHRDSRVDNNHNDLDPSIYRQNSKNESRSATTLGADDGPSSPETSMSNLETFAPDDDLPTTPTTPTTSTPSSPRVHFRSRVRITSGLHRHRRRWYDVASGAPAPPSSCSSSRSGSPSSSISAPLRTHPDSDSSYNTGWGPLGQRVSYFVSRQRTAQDKEAMARRWRPASRGLEPSSGRVHPNEHTPLARSPMRSSYVEGEGLQDSDVFDSEEDDVDDARLSREIDLLFGQWPGRLLNHRWWWWQLEPLLYCHCMDDPDVYD